MAKQQVTVGLAAEVLVAVDAYRLNLPVAVSRSKAIEALVVLGIRTANPQLALWATDPGASTRGGEEAR